MSGGTAQRLLGDHERERDAVSEPTTIDYVFSGKLVLFPVGVLVLSFSAGFVVTYGPGYFIRHHTPIKKRYFEIVGAALLFLSALLLVFLVRFIVTKISFTFSPGKLTIVKHGFLKKSVLEFAVHQVELFYVRTHMTEENAWLQLAVKEGPFYYLVASWKGKGNQRRRFLRLFYTVHDELEFWQARSPFHSLGKPGGRPPPRSRNCEIVCREEMMLVSPFTMRLRALGQEMSELTALGGMEGEDVIDTKWKRSRTDSLCIEDLDVVSFDAFFRHFDMSKTLAHGIRGVRGVPDGLDLRPRKRAPTTTTTTTTTSRFDTF